MFWLRRCWRSLNTMSSSLKARFERLERMPADDRAPSGSRALFALRLSSPPGNGFPKTIDAMQSLVRRGMNLLNAKRAVEAMLEGREVVVDLPSVDDPDILTAELVEAGITATLTLAKTKKAKAATN